ncbi:MAG TPA: hypothetical protein VNK52_09155 [Hyphomicrobiaceae bacterium]|nr:hypothetical protein [Hyphomicrobiaceae bacterium]
MRWIMAMLVVLLALSEPAYAYLDPGTGSFILQMMLAGALAVGASVKLFWHRIKSVCLKLFSGSAQGVHDRK